MRRTGMRALLVALAVVVLGFAAPAIAPAKSVRPAIFVAVTAGRASGPAAASLRNLKLADLQKMPEVTVDVRQSSGARHRYAVDGVVSRIDHGVTGDLVELTCEVRLTVSDPRGRLLGIVSASATAMRPRAKYNPSMDAAMESEALEGAVQGVHGELVTFLTRDSR
jgi:hypothetical protein